MKKYAMLVVVTIFVVGLFNMNISADESKSFIQKFVQEQNPEAVIIDSENADSLNTITVDNGNGTNSVYMFNENVRYEDEQGDIIDKDLSLIGSGDKEKLAQGYILSVKANDIESDYPMSLKNRGFRVDEIEIKPVDSNAVLTETTSDEAYYENVFEGINIACTPALNGLSGVVTAANIECIKNVKLDISDKK